MFRTAVVCVLAMAAAWAQAPKADEFQGKPRAFVLSDIGNEPDDQMSLVRLLVYSNELDIEGLVATTSNWQRKKVQPETMRELVKAYGEVLPRLQEHAAGWPKAEDLLARVAAGQADYGMAAVGLGKSSEGARALLRAMLKEDERPLWVLLWGGANTLAQSLMEARAVLRPEELKPVLERLRVYTISDQDDAGAWIRREFPTVYYVGHTSSQDSGDYLYATWTGISGDAYYKNGDGADGRTVTNEWLETNVRAKGALGKHYPKFMFIMEGDTPSFLGLLNNGLNAYRRPDWGGWGGRYLWRVPKGETRAMWTQGGDMFGRVSSMDTVMGVDGREHTSDQASIWRWREAFQNDFAARMDWTVKGPKEANHNPVVVVNGEKGTGVVRVKVKEGATVRLSAKGTADPDEQRLNYRWYVYAEAGAAGGALAEVKVEGKGEEAEVKAVAACRALWLPMPRKCEGGVAHVILEVTDEGTPRLTSYRRVIVEVGK